MRSIADSKPERSRQYAPVVNTGPSPVFSRDDASGAGIDQDISSQILIVEDDYLIAMQAEDALSEAGFTLTGIAASADEAIALARTHRPVLAIMDIRLVGKRDGIDAALELFRTQNIRCIFATAHADRTVMERAAPARPLAWLQKPYTVQSLVAAVRAALNELA